MRTQVRDGGKLSPVADAKPTAIGGGLIAFAVFEVLFSCSLHAVRCALRAACWTEAGRER